MPFHYELVDNARLVHVWSSGDSTYAEAHDMWDRKFGNPRLPPDYLELVDLRKTGELKESVDATDRLRQLILRNIERLPRRMAIVATAPGPWRMGKLWESQSDEFGRRCMVFGEFHIACIWLGIEQKALRHVETEFGA
jgi:hypothetical protein